MPASRFTVQASDLHARIRTHLLNGLPPTPASLQQVVWQEGGSELLVYPSSLATRLTQGWLVVEITVSTVQTGKKMIRQLLFLGQPGRGAGLQASVGYDPANDTSLQQRWGPALHNAIWNAVMDVMEGTLAHAEKTLMDEHGKPTSGRWALSGFTGGEASLQITLSR